VDRPVLREVAGIVLREVAGIVHPGADKIDEKFWNTPVE
jgi:uncharacterized alkaline shock family protein YloU